MAAKKATKTKPKAGKETASNGGGAAVVIAKPTITRTQSDAGSLYEDAVKEIVALSENDTYSRKVDNGPLAEARGKDTWRLHSQLRATDQLNLNVQKTTGALKVALAELDDHLHTDTSAVTQLVERHGSSLARAVHTTQTSVSERIGEATDGLTQRVERFQSMVKESFSKLGAATAGSEENLRTQTDAFGKEVESLLGNLRSELDGKISEFRDEATRLIDKRFNQADVAFAAVRADQEVIKALLTDIIKDRMGRPEPKVR